MALQAHLKLKGVTQGAIDGSVTQKGREKTIAVIAVQHQIISPRDPATGMPSGKRQHKPFVITKELDKATPLLYNALVNNESISEWELKFYTPGTQATKNIGKEQNHYTVKLTNATVASIDFYMENTRRPPEGKDVPEYEKIAFTYQKIEWSYDDGDGARQADDDWEAPQQ
ncbi:Hcp family type VI secretion system effector [Sorangium sp. So ce1024]|jgi:type VI secretion system secreted protein Hcp|uniref:Hcp family type VI secretion system effector n=1 Tax=unclassified Sorangium TaxID=2621164 RepID=UPI003F0F9EBC